MEFSRNGAIYPVLAHSFRKQYLKSKGEMDEEGFRINVKNSAISEFQSVQNLSQQDDSNPPRFNGYLQFFQMQHQRI